MTKEVRIVIKPDLEPYDVSFVDTWKDMSKNEKDDTKRNILAEAEEKGVYGYVVEEKCEHCNNWTQIDSCYGFLGQGQAIEEAKFAHPDGAKNIIYG